MNLDTHFAIDFGNLLELYLDQYGNVNLIDQVCFILQVEKAELGQVFNGYDTPSVGLIFELLRTINDTRLTHPFLKMPSTLGVNFELAETKVVKVEPPKPKRIIDPEFDLGDDDFGDFEL